MTDSRPRPSHVPVWFTDQQVKVLNCRWLHSHEANIFLESEIKRAGIV